MFFFIMVGVGGGVFIDMWKESREYRDREGGEEKRDNWLKDKEWRWKNNEIILI